MQGKKSVMFQLLRPSQVEACHLRPYGINEAGSNGEI